MTGRRSPWPGAAHREASVRANECPRSARAGTPAGRGGVGLLMAAALLFTGSVVLEGPTIFLIGDSTMAEKPLIGNPERGWGMAFPAFLKEGVRLENHAKNGRSTKSFIREGRWDSVLRVMKPGDYVLIQFGHNDAKVTDTSRYAAPRVGYRQNLLRFVREAREKGGIPILLTPVTRRRFSEGKVVDSHAEYSAVAKEVGREESLPVIDVDSLSMDLLAAAGEEESKGLYLYLRAGVLSRLDTGRIDNTHFNSRGARAIAALVASDVRKRGLPLGELLGQSPPPAVAPEKTVLLDCFYNNEWRPDDSGTPVRYHYVWHDTTNSGFSVLAKLITDAGACIDTLCQAPSASLLRRASVYVIVDPDTPKESPSPNTLQADAIGAIVRWVEDGGVLLLLGNDKGNAEFEQWNLLAREFGIHFREESLARVVGKEYGTGTFENLPEHPIFRNVRRIFLKEISPLTLSGCSTPVLTSGGEVIMAASRKGKGLVLAVGDPWLYNEYIDTRRLPPGYDNARAGENLFRWLLEQASPVAWREGK
jgi:lysophospholipase L1-like esterase